MINRDVKVGVHPHVTSHQLRHELHIWSVISLCVLFGDEYAGFCQSCLPVICCSCAASSIIHFPVKFFDQTSSEALCGRHHSGVLTLKLGVSPVSESVDQNQFRSLTATSCACPREAQQLTARRRSHVCRSDLMTRPQQVRGHKTAQFAVMLQ